MQNKWNGCQAGGFVPADTNWDFARCGRGQETCPRCNRKREQCACTANTTQTRTRETCGCERRETRCTQPCGNEERRETRCTQPCGNEERRETRCTQPCGNEERRETRCTQPYTCGTTERTDDWATAAKTGQRYGQPCGNGLTLGMVTARVQTLDDMYDAAHALKAGTLFPGLHMPLSGYCPRGGNCATEAQEAAFTLWELRLYLNTHPHDQEALALFARLCRCIEGNTYATAFLPDGGCGQDWNWNNDPWPWEYACCCGG